MSHTQKLTIVLILALIFPATASLLDAAALKSGVQTCPTSGIKQLSITQVKASWVSLQAPSGNTGAVAFGDTTITVAAACAVARGNCILASGSAFLPALGNSAAYDLAQIWIACTASSDAVMFNYLQ